MGSAPRDFRTRFQQTTPPIMAKGVEDTAFYRYLRLLALCDVGGDPSRFAIDVGTFHAGNAARAERFPRHLLASQTHDTKRSGDVRARLGALASLAEPWADTVRRLEAASAPLWAEPGGPDAVVLREATRRAGVVPNAAYRHFASRWELLQAVRSAALSALAVAMARTSTPTNDSSTSSVRTLLNTCVSSATTVKSRPKSSTA